LDDQRDKPQGRRLSGLTPREASIAVFVFLVMLIQIVVPAAVLASGPSEERGSDDYLYRYGWQMFTESEQEFRYEAVLAGGHQQSVVPTLLLGHLWGNIHYGNAVLDRLCRAVPEAEMIVREISPRSGGHASMERYACL
jgi:hypothetical protein